MSEIAIFSSHYDKYRIFMCLHVDFFLFNNVLTLHLFHVPCFMYVTWNLTHETSVSVSPM